MEQASKEESGAESPSKESEPKGSPFLRLLLEIGPLISFFYANAKYDIFAGTKVFMVAIVISLAVSYRLEKRLPVLPLVTAGFVLVFGGLTLWLDDSLFIKLKPTIVNALFGTILLGGLAFGRSLIKPIFATAFELTDAGWRVLTLRWGVFLFVLAGLNEYVWRNFTEDQWVTFKVFGILPLTLFFSMAQMPALTRYAVEGDQESAD